MKHGYIDIPAQPEPLQELLWRRQALANKLGAVALYVVEANKEYNSIIAEIIQLNGEINDAEAMLQ